MKLLIRKLIIKSEKDTVEDLTFKEGLTMIFSENNELITDVIKNLLKNKATRKKCGEGLHFYAEIETDEKYTARGSKKSHGYIWYIKIYDKNGEECSESYYEWISKSSEEFSLIFPSDFKKSRYSQRIYQYKNADSFYRDDSLAKATGNISLTRFFRAYITDYVHGFFSVCMSREKQLYLIMTPEGKFKVACGTRNYHPILSVSDNTEFQYYCWMQLVEFWVNLRYITDRNSPILPICISGLTEGLDEEAQIGRILADTEKMPLQTILFVSCHEKS